jgi:hypothetical protein
MPTPTRSRTSASSSDSVAADPAAANSRSASAAARVVCRGIRWGGLGGVCLNPLDCTTITGVGERKCPPCFATCCWLPRAPEPRRRARACPLENGSGLDGTSRVSMPSLCGDVSHSAGSPGAAGELPDVSATGRPARDGRQSPGSTLVYCRRCCLDRSGYRRGMAAELSALPGTVPSNAVAGRSASRLPPLRINGRDRAARGRSADRAGARCGASGA